MLAIFNNLPTRPLAERGLELSKAKTLITHINVGFDFLGWSFRKYDGTLLIKPSKESIGKITDKIRGIIHKAAAWTQEQLIKALNPVITGWANYRDRFEFFDFDLINY